MSVPDINPNSKHILRRCSGCREVNRVVLSLAMHARCGRCGDGLLLSHYDVLGVKESATPADLKAAYRSKVLFWHPDKRPGDPDSNQRFQSIVASYKTLSDVQKRLIYNQTALPEIHLKPAALLHHEPKRAKAKQRSHESSTSANSDMIPISQGSLVQLVTTTAAMVTGVVLWLITGPHNSGLMANLLLWIALGTGVIGLGKFLVSLAYLGTRDTT